MEVTSCTRFGELVQVPEVVVCSLVCTQELHRGQLAIDRLHLLDFDAKQLGERTAKSSDDDMIGSLGHVGMRFLD
eukprot:3731835-Amphidinium_carterae.1